ncbi:MAG: Gfo/Idh/MocA family oxidoreductase [Candidatus Saganbacteria bacterium]|nr:Gfo/Idh/MocA family oxidoreductase [Candidatus Saganbacteria bacterium]
MRKSKQNKRFRVGVIGVGFMGSLHARVLSAIRGVSLFGVFDTDLDKAKEVAANLKTKFFEDYNLLIQECDALVVSSPTSTHFEIGITVIEAGKHLFIEKPLASSSYEGKILVDRAKEKGLVLATGHIERFNPAYVAAEKMLYREKPLILNIKRLSPFPERITDANVITDMMIHDLDLAMNIAGSPVDSIKARGKKIKTKVLDQVFAHILFQNGLIANIEADRTRDTKVREIEAICESCNLVIDLLAKKIRRRELPDLTLPLEFKGEEIIPVERAD